VKLALHFGTNALGPYEFHRDEFLYMAMGEHLQLFRMDFPPFIAMVSQLARGLLGDSLFAVRFFPALFGTGLMALAALIAREFGGGRFAQGLAALCVLCNPLFMRSGTLFQPVVFDQFWWTLGLYALVRWSKEPEPRWWLVFGAACGLGLLSKFSVLVFGLAVLLALTVTPARRALKTPWPWVAAAMAFVIGSPSIIGQIRLGLPIFDQMGDLRSAQLARVTPLEFLIEQVLWNPATGIVLFAGLAALVGSKRFRPFGLVGWSCLWALILLVVLRGKPYYAGPVHPTLFAAGAVVLERLRIPRWGAVLRWGAVTAVVAWGMLSLPLGFPVLPPPRMEAYVTVLGDEGARTTNIGEIERLPQDYADMLGWREFVAAVADVYHGLPPADREQAVILASNYGEAGAIDFYGTELGLPKAVAVVGTYWFFGPGERPGEVIVVIGFARDEIGDRFSTLDSAAHWTHPYMVAEQRNLTFFVGRGPEETLQQIWPRFEGAQ
jgi:4-amino-4-deoxy-L-arabinose transferase-like glycosyltransferase